MPPTHVTGSGEPRVLIVGAGPTGMTAAVRLAGLGIPHLLLDAAPGPTLTSNAALVHASAIELFAELGVAGEIVDAGSRLNRIRVSDRGRDLLRIGLNGVPSRYPFALGIPQSSTEAILGRRLAELGGTVRRNHAVTAVRKDGDGYVVTADATTPSGVTSLEIRARYVIAADGSHSAVRPSVGIAFPGDTCPSQFVLADTALDGLPCASDEAAINLSPDGVTVIGRLPGGTHRIIATFHASADVPQAPGRRFMDDLLRARRIGARLAAEPAWSSRFRVHHRVAGRFRAGGIFLAGDAAHVHSPAAGQGMNTGIADAYDIATRLAALINGRAPAALLDGYDTARRAAAQEVVRFTDRMTRMAMLRSPAARALRRAGAGTAGRLPPVRNRVTMWVTGLERSPLRGGLPAVHPQAVPYNQDPR